MKKLILGATGSIGLSTLDVVLRNKELFDVFKGFSGSHNSQPEIFLSHPTSEDRWEKLRDYSLLRGWNIEGEMTPLDFKF